MMVWVVGVAVIVKSGGEVTATDTIVVWEREPLVPVIATE